MVSHELYNRMLNSIYILPPHSSHVTLFQSTLLRAIACRGDVLSSGNVTLRKGTRLGYLEQTAVSGSTLSVWAEARSSMTRVNNAISRLEAAEVRPTWRAGGASSGGVGGCDAPPREGGALEADAAHGTRRGSPN